MKNFTDKLQLFKNKLEEIYNSKSESIFNTHYLNRNKTFRINFLIEKDQNKVLESLKSEGVEFEKLESINFYLVTKESTQLSRTSAFNNKWIYIQEASSALPVIELNPQAKESILDMCASPGSKTSLIQSLTLNGAQVTAVEKSRERFFKLKTNLNENGVTNVNVINADANRLPFMMPHLVNFFEKVLVDVPCTTESKIDLNSEDSLREWKTSNAKDISKLQKGLLNSAFKMLKKGGVLVYSTCTYSVEENEQVVNWFLKKNEDAKLIDVDLRIENLIHGLTEYKNKEFNGEILKTRRVLPNNKFTAFYLAKIIKL